MVLVGHTEFMEKKLSGDSIVMMSISLNYFIGLSLTYHPISPNKALCLMWLLEVNMEGTDLISSKIL